eukprot:CAMPEP_0118978922 /NCGR_PEP_ID=MMETSP1173-20130426/24784_1 /TAXON_ID=1034831 /ORGANISM="Rhizochromulina marina cf, Strain CCMP1243" /LENGTH=66 /DNA_ID=CAMNT_0006929153 /DNA_START=349 /DNA_END=552 /DNA_ORIENTATION=-
MRISAATVSPHVHTTLRPVYVPLTSHCFGTGPRTEKTVDQVGTSIVATCWHKISPAIFSLQVHEEP